MVDAVNTIGGTNTVVAPAQQSVNSSAATVDDTAKQTTTASKNSAAPLFFTNRSFSDPTSGVFVSEQLDSSGNIIAQTPQSTALAYLRIGLNSEGLPKQSTVA